MTERIITGCMLIVAIIHLLPLSGVLGVAQLGSLYDVEIAGSDLEILMRHRAVLFGLLGLFFAYSAFRPDIQPIAFGMAFVSIISFIALAYSVGGFNIALRRVIIADVAAAVSLVIAVLLYLQK